MVAVEVHGAHPVLVALSEQVYPQTVVLVDEVYLIGRWNECQVVVRADVVSRVHAQIKRHGPRYMISDMGSANGTFVNGRRVDAPRVLMNEDVVGLSGVIDVLRFDDPLSTRLSGVQLNYDVTTATFAINGMPIDLTGKPFLLLHYLYQHSGELCTRAGCVETVWEHPYSPDIDDDVLDRTMANLRKSIRAAGELMQLSAKETDVIQVRRGLGYQLVL